MADPYRRLLVLVVSAAVVVVAAAAALTRYADPYWLTDPSSTRVYLPALDTQMRYAKALQIMSRSREARLKVVLVGSSTVYRGLNPAALDYPPGAVYNLGISSLRMQEAHAYVEHLLLFSQPETVLIGLDFFQFDGLTQTESGFEPGLGSYASAIEMYLASIASRNAISGSFRILKTRKPRDDDDGPWSREGYRQTAPRNAENIQLQLERAVIAYHKTDTRLPGPYDDLRKCIRLLQRRNISVKLYLSPIHAKYESAIRSAGKEPQYLNWKQRIRAIAAEHGLTLLEIDKLHKFSDSDFDGVSGFNDPTHFSEWVGTMIMREVGLPVRASTVPANGKRS